MHHQGQHPVDAFHLAGQLGHRKVEGDRVSREHPGLLHSEVSTCKPRGCYVCVLAKTIETRKDLGSITWQPKKLKEKFYIDICILVLARSTS